MPQRARSDLQKLLTWQNEEGWFYEYQGCDPGYLTLTLSLLAEINLRGYHDGLLHSLEKAVDFLDNFVHPDGSFGGEYTSRNTYNFFPHGFEMLGWQPAEMFEHNRAVLPWAAKRQGGLLCR